jgi:formate dehydrogenase iron-sulfur subunit
MSIPQSLPIITKPQACAAPTVGSASGSSFIKQLLAEQQELTAVEQFANLHEQSTVPAQAKYYRNLMPASPPEPGQQYAFDVDLDSCSGCKACVTACHTLNGLDEEETWRDVGLLIGGTSQAPAMQHVTAACHHCLEPACMTACPVNAYEKDPVTGIVKHLDDQCFGCKYCTLACPYEVPKYHHDKGIVRKCDMCSSRLSVGEAPACVQACPHEAIRIHVVETSLVAENAEAVPFLPAAPDPQITLPTTTYRTKHAFPRNMLPADYFSVSPQEPRWPLVIMLVLTQLSVGAFIAGLSMEFALPTDLWNDLRPVHAVGGLVVGLLALSASVFHLGRPQFAYRAVLGLRHSWLSREIVAFGAFAGLAIAYAISVFALGRVDLLSSATVNLLAWAVAIAGFGGVLCSCMIYIFTRREFWSPLQTTFKFVMTTAVLGVASFWLSMLLTAGIFGGAEIEEVVNRLGRPSAQLLILLSASKLIWEAFAFRHLLNRKMTSLKRSALLMTRQLSSVTMMRFAAGMLGGVIMPAMLLGSTMTAGETASPKFLVAATLLVMACVVGELLERYLYFAAAAAPRMPGGIR